MKSFHYAKTKTYFKVTKQCNNSISNIRTMALHKIGVKGQHLQFMQCQFKRQILEQFLKIFAQKKYN